MNDTYNDFVTIHIFCFKSQDRRRPKADSEGGRDGGEHSKHIDQYEARVLLCTQIERPSPGPEAGLLTLMMVCSSGVFVFLGQNIVVTAAECIRYTAVQNHPKEIS
jgi:hypothetical protein